MDKNIVSIHNIHEKFILLMEKSRMKDDKKLQKEVVKNAFPFILNNVHCDKGENYCVRKKY